MSARHNGYQRSVRDFGAAGDGDADDRKAIQATIDTVAANGGGVVYFPAGTYKVTVYTPAAGRFHWPRVFTIKPNVTLQGVNSATSIIKLADNQVPYGALLAPDPLGADVSGFGMYNLGVDINGLNNPLPTAAELNEAIWEKRRNRNTVFINSGRGLRFEHCRFSNFIGTWCLNLYSYYVSNVRITNNVFDKVGGGSLDFDSSTVDTAGNNCRITNNKFYSRNYNSPKGPLNYGLRTAIEVHNVNALVANNQIYGFPIGINFGGNTPRGNRSITASDNYIENAFNGIIIYADKPDDGSAVGMQDCTISGNTITLNVNGWQFTIGNGNQCHGISIEREGNLDAQVRNLNVTNNHIYYTNYNGTRDPLIDAYSSGIYYDRDNWQKSTIGVSSKNLFFNNNTIDHPLGNGFYFRCDMSEVEISSNTVTDPAAGPASFWDGWKAAMFFVGPTTDLSVSGNKIVDDRASGNIPYGLFAINDNCGYCIARGNRLVDGNGNDLCVPLLHRESGLGSWDVRPGE
jgi:hypothetical protein